MLSEEVFAVNFQYVTFPLIAFMALLLICMSIFFFLNYRLLSLLEREDWPALAYYLEQKIFVKNRYSNRNVRLLASSYLVISDYMSVLKLENKAFLAKPSVVDKNVLVFGSARILSGNHGEAAAFFKSHIGKCKGKERQWVRWFYGFSHLLGGAFSSAEPEFTSLAVSSSDALISGLSSYFLSRSMEKYSLRPKECRDSSENGKERVAKALRNIDGWNREADKIGTEIHIAIIKKYVDEAGRWIFDLLPPETPNEHQAEEFTSGLLASAYKLAGIRDDRRGTDRRVADRRTNDRGTPDRRVGDRRVKKDS